MTDMDTVQPPLTEHELYVLRMWELIGMENTNILLNRWQQHQAGLDLMCEPYESHPHIVNPIQNLPEPVCDGTKRFSSFADQMKVIEEEFLSGKRKRPGE